MHDNQFFPTKLAEYDRTQRANRFRPLRDLIEFEIVLDELVDKYADSDTDPQRLEIEHELLKLVRAKLDARASDLSFREIYGRKLGEPTL